MRGCQMPTPQKKRFWWRWEPGRLRFLVRCYSIEAAQIHLESFVWATSRSITDPVSSTLKPGKKQAIKCRSYEVVSP